MPRGARRRHWQLDALSSARSLRYRHYRADAAVTVALTLMPAEELPDLAALEAALRRPERPLFIGRKACPPSRPILDRAVEAESLVAALDHVAPLRPDPKHRRTIC